MMNPVSFFCPVCSRRTNQKPRAFSPFLSDQQKSVRVCLRLQNQKIASIHAKKISLNVFLLTCAAAKNFHSHRNMAIPGPWIKSHIPSVDRRVNWLLYHRPAVEITAEQLKYKKIRNMIPYYVVVSGVKAFSWSTHASKPKVQLNYIQLAGKYALSVVNLITGGKPVKRKRCGKYLMRFFWWLAGGHQGANFKRSVRQLVMTPISTWTSN